MNEEHTDNNKKNNETDNNKKNNERACGFSKKCSKRLTDLGGRCRCLAFVWISAGCAFFLIACSAFSINASANSFNKKCEEILTRVEEVKGISLENRSTLNADPKEKFVVIIEPAKPAIENVQQENREQLSVIKEDAVSAEVFRFVDSLFTTIVISVFTVVILLVTILSPVSFF